MTRSVWIRTFPNDARAVYDDPTEGADEYVSAEPTNKSAASRKRDTKCEWILRRQLWRLGLRYRVDVADLPGRPDVVFARARVVVFCDGDFWHGRNLDERVRRLQRADGGWLALRFWESDIYRDAAAIAAKVATVVATRVSEA